MIIVYLAGIVFSFASTLLLSGESSSKTQIVFGTLAAGAALLGASRIITILLLKIKYNRGIYETWKEDVDSYLPSDAINVLTAGLGMLALVVLWFSGGSRWLHS